jgi:hypothetical protein
VTGRPVWTVAQIGARESYAAARAFVAVGRLGRLYTDVWCRRWYGVLRRGPAALRSIANRGHPEVPNEQVVSFTPSAMWNELRTRLRRDRAANQYDTYLRVGRWFDRRVRARLCL